MTTSNQKTASKLTNWELLIIFIGFVSIVCLIISVYAAHIKERFYPWLGPVAYEGPWGGPASGGPWGGPASGGPWGGPASGGPWNIPTRYPIRGWGWDIRGYPAPYPIDYGVYGYPRPAYPAPEPDGTTNSTPSANTKSTNQAPFGIEMTPTTKPSTTKPSTLTTDTKSSNNKKAAQNKAIEAAEDRAAEEWYEKESRWWPDWVSWPWRPYFNYGLHYDVNGKLKPSNNDSIVANHTWSWW